MALIKSTSAPARLLPFSMADIEKQARSILLRAQHQAEQILAEAQREAESLRQEAHAKGSAAGYEEGLARGIEQGRQLGHEQALGEHREQLAAAVGTLAVAMGELDARRRELESGAVREL